MAANPRLDEVVTASNVDLSNCDREVIHTPGLIQPHGVMLVLRATDLSVVQASENITTIFGVTLRDVLSRGLAGVLGIEPAAVLGTAIAQAGVRLHRGPTHLLTLPATESAGSFDALVHRIDDWVIVELERVDASRPPFTAYAELADFMASLQSAGSLRAYLDITVRQVRAFSGFDRVMAYRFAADGAGEVIAEARCDDLNGYLGMHFPGSDIPAPARRLFALSWLRHLPAVDYLAVPMLPATGPPVDMSRAILRHVSVMYTSYLKNMGVQATMVIPLMKAGQLWGLISCMHHAAPLHVPYRTRTAAELLAHQVSSLLSEQVDRDTAAYRDSMKAAIAGLDRQMTQALEYQQGLCRGEFTLLGWLDAPGAALVTQDGILLFGDTPTEPQVRGIIGWLNEQDVTVPVFATDRLPELYPPAEMFRTFASGLLTARLVQRETEFVMWFRPEQVQTVAWAGDPTKPVQVDVVDGEARLTPRMSFELWKQEVQGRSAPWLDCEIEAAAVLRRAIAEVVLLRLNESLRQSNAELDSFAYAAAHDLKEPLRGIHNFAHFLKRSADSKLTEEEQGRIQTIMQLTRRMDDLTDALLHYSRIGQTELLREKLDLNEVLERVLELLSARLVETGTVVSIPRRLPPVETDRISLTGILTNLVVNAIKYNDRPAGDRGIEIGWRDEVGRQVFYVRDNGIGIAERHLEHVFRIFRRLHGRSEYGGGSGAGLTIARRAAERLGGRLWAESPGAGLGTTFLFTLGLFTSGEAVP
jgi:light-regulated signal transduction histidine kinase (bacteriophytochrome)